MKVRTTILSTMIIFQLQAQTFTYSAFSSGLSGTLNAAIADISTFNTALATTTGTGITWDASDIEQQTGTPVIHFVFADPAGTPYADLFPGSNYVQYDPALTALIDYNYYIITADSMSTTGEYAPSAEHEIFQNPDKRLVFPFSYSASFTDTYAKTNYSDATTISSYQTGMRTVTFNGYGTLILPQGEFTNVALISEMRTNSLGPNSTYFTWYDLTTGKQLMYYSENDGNVVAAFTVDIPASLAEVSGPDISLYPNPVSGKANISLKGEGFQYAELIVINAEGKTVQSFSVTANTTSFSTRGMAAGMYYYRFITDNKTIQTGKFIVE